MNINNTSTTIVDFHVHAFPDDVAERAIEALLTSYGAEAATNGTISHLLQHMQKTGVDYSVLQPVATKPSQVHSINDWAASHTDPSLISFGGIHPGYNDVAGEIDRIVDLGLPGIKLQGNWQDVYIDSSEMYSIYEAAQGRLIILFHSGAELAPFEEMKATPRQIANIHADFPDLTIVAAHMGGYQMWDEVEKYLIGKNIYLDTSACFPHDLGNERFLRLIHAHGVEKILFATDLPCGDPLNDIPRFQNMGLTDTDLEHIFYKNAKQLLGDRIKC